MLERRKIERGVVEIVDTESLVPQEHLLRKVDRAVDFGKIYKIVEPLAGPAEEGGLQNGDKKHHRPGLRRICEWYALYLL